MQSSNSSIEIPNLKHAILAMLLLTGCNAPSVPQDPMVKLQRFSGQKTEEFFASYGNPASKTTLKNGRTLYRWVSIEPEAAPSISETHLYPSPRGSFAVLEPSSGPIKEPQHCELGIEADKKGMIRKLYVINDTAGKHSTSLCREIFQ